jgi:NAD(P)-dependent dehydrogenase (short-subunit alcohol dehydrogenase family)
MRFRFEALPPALAAALERAMLAAGHEPAATLKEAEAIAVGAPVPGLGETLLEVEPVAWEETVAALRTAFVAVRDFSRAALDREEGGRAVVVVDPVAARVAAGAGLSAVAGGFLTTLAQVAALDLGPRGIAVNVFLAGWTEPPASALAAGAPIGRPAEPDEVAAACAFLLSPQQAGYVNGAVLAADGGWNVAKVPGANPLLSS